MSDDCEHDFDYIGRGYHDGSHPGWAYDEFFCRRCLTRVAVQDGTNRHATNLDPQWFHRERRQ